MTSNRIFLLLLLGLFSCSDKSAYLNYDRWKVNDWKGFAYVKGQPKEVTTTYFISLPDTELNATGRPLDTELSRFDEQGQLTYLQISNTDSRQENQYNYVDEGIVTQSTSRSAANENIELGNTREVRKRTGDHSFVTTTYNGNNIQQVDSVTFGPDGDLRLTRINGQHQPYSIITWYRNNRVVKEEFSDSYGRSGRLYHRDAKDNLDSISFSNPIEKEIFVNNAQGDPVLHYHTIGTDTVQSERMRYLYDARGNWTRRIIWKKNLEPPIALLTNPSFPHYILTVRSFRY